MPLSTTGNRTAPVALPVHNPHDPVDHALHDHHPACGHWSVLHDGHLDYLHDGHAHHWHGTHWDECPITAEAFAVAKAPRRRTSRRGA